MKICLFIDSLSAGGAQRQLVGLGRLLKEQGYDVTIITYHKDEFYLPSLIGNGITYYYMPKAENKATRIYHVVRFLKKDKPDVLISFLSSPNIIACIAKFFIGKIKLIVSERNTTQQIGRKEQIRFALYRFADIIVPNSYSQEKFIKTSYPQFAKKTVTITNFVDTDYFKPAAKRTQNRIPIIISVGRITPQKNILNYLSALKILIEKGLKFKAIWFGNTDRDEYFQSCKLSIDKLELRDCFEFRPATNEIKSEYQKADIFCLPSIFEGFPNVLCEAMCCGLPVVCSNVCDNPLIVQQGKSGMLFEPNDVDKMAFAIEEILNLPEAEKELMGVFNREKAIGMSSEKTFVKKYLQIIK